MNKSVGLQKAGLLFAVDEIPVDGIEQVAVPARCLARQHQQLIPLAHAIDDEDRLLLEARVRTAQALCPLARLRAAIEEEEADLAAIARCQRLCDFEQRHDARGVGVAVVLLIRAVLRIKKHHDQKQQKKRQHHARQIQRERHGKGKQKAARNQQQRIKRLIEQKRQRPRRADERRQEFPHTRVVMRRKNDLRLVDIAHDHIRHAAARGKRALPALKLRRVAKLLERVDEPCAKLHFFFFLAAQRKIPLDACSKLIHAVFPFHRSVQKPPSSCKQFCFTVVYF